MKKDIPYFFCTHIEIMGPHFCKFHLSDGRVVHRFSEADHGFPHNHPFPFSGYMLYGGYHDRQFMPREDGRPAIFEVDRKAGDSYEVGADTIHLLTELHSEECWTIITPGQKVQEPGFFRWDNEGMHYRQWNEDFHLVTPKQQ